MGGVCMSELNKKLYSNLLCLVISIITLAMTRSFFRDAVSTGVYGAIIIGIGAVVLFFVYRVTKYTTLLVEENKEKKDS